MINMRLHCKTDSKILCQFLNLCSGNWHNCVYVRCHCKQRSTCYLADFLFLPDKVGKPIILPLNDCSLVFSLVPNQEECLLSITSCQFIKMYAAYIDDLSLPTGSCTLCCIHEKLIQDIHSW